MTERPILFSAPMVRALLDGSKTQTRRIMKVQPIRSGNFWEVFGAGWSDRITKVPAVSGHSLASKCPFGKVGDQLWVRETWRTDDSLDSKAPSTFSSWPVKYEADGKVLTHGAFHGNTKGKTRTSIHMPRWASRITLEITSIHIERLQDIGDEDAKAEGCVVWPECTEPAAINAFRAIWDLINGAESWDANPWVWVIEFKRKDEQ